MSEFHRRNSVQIEIDDRTIAERRLDGYFRLRVDAPDKLADLLDAERGIAVVKDRSRNVIRLGPLIDWTSQMAGCWQSRFDHLEDLLKRMDQ